MTRPGKRIAVAIGVVGMAIGILAVLLLAPALREKWYLRQLEVGDEQARIAAAQQLGQMGSVEAVPVLSTLVASAAERFAAEQPEAVERVRVYCEASVSGLTLIRELDATTGDEHDVAIKTAAGELLANELESIDTVLKECDQFVHEFYDDGVYFEPLLACLNRSDAVGRLVDALATGSSNETWIRRSLNAYLLGGLGERAKSALPYLERHRDDDDPFVRYQIERAIYEIQR